MAGWVLVSLQELVEQSLPFDLGDSTVAEDFAFFLRLLISMRRQHHRVTAVTAVAAPVPVEDDARSEVSAASAVSAMELKLRAWRVMISGWQN